jgi:hypothetical protein
MRAPKAKSYLAYTTWAGGGGLPPAPALPSHPVRPLPNPAAGGSRSAGTGNARCEPLSDLPVPAMFAHSGLHLDYTSSGPLFSWRHGLPSMEWCLTQSPTAHQSIACRGIDRCDFCFVHALAFVSLMQLTP